MKRLRLRLILLERLGRLGLMFWVCIALATFAFADDASSPKQEEEAELRLELQRIIKEDPEHGADAQKALDALDQPEDSRAGRQARNRRELGIRRIVNGIASRRYPAIGALLQGNDPRQARAACTGTLVGCDKFLTAAHCIKNKPTPGAYLVYFPELGFFRIKAIAWEQYKYDTPIFDLAMLTLAMPVEGIAPLPVNANVKAPSHYLATIVGFGRTGGAREDYGIKREGSVMTKACPVAYAEKKVFCWSFDADVRSKKSASNTCNADSGGGILMRDRDGSRIVEKVFGVVTGGEVEDCMKHDLSYNVDVSEYREWIERAGDGRLTSSMCGAPLLKAANGQITRQTLRLGDKMPKASVTFRVADGARELRVAMNYSNNIEGENAFDFAAYTEADTRHAKDMCSGSGSGAQFAFCKLDYPAAGAWTIEVMRKKGAGDVQITALSVGAP
jgi:hypothetical protein